MKAAVQAHAHSMLTFATIVMVALVMGSTIQTSVSANTYSSGLPTEPIDLPGPGEDLDGDSYPDSTDVFDGNLVMRLQVDALQSSAGAPYLMVGTQDDQWRHGAGRALEWPHVEDHDSFGHKVGSQAWTNSVIRTGSWWTSTPMEGASKAMSPSSIDLNDAPHDAEWPQVFWIDVRDDRLVVTIHVELFDGATKPDQRLGAWALSYDLVSQNWTAGDATAGQNESLRTGSLAGGTGPGLEMRLAAMQGYSLDEQVEIASRHAPIVMFDSEERFFPTTGEALQAFHGFNKTSPRDRDYRTWTRDFNNGRDSYVLLLADFDGSGIVDHQDAAVMTDVLRAGSVAPDNIYTRVHQTTGDRVVVQFWFIYIYNFVWDESAKDIRFLAHRGDREFVQLTFANETAAKTGRPESISYSQHYKGITFKDPEIGEAPYHLDDEHIAVYPARGSHASYPAPGDDRRFRNAFAGFGDEFDGEGEVWTPGNYTLQPLQGQDWFAGYLWGPATRHSRDLGTASKPLLQHSFEYPYTDPLPWQRGLLELRAEDLLDVYGVEA